MRIRILIVPGLNGSGPGHWQTIWEEKYRCEHVHQRDWENPDLTQWVETLNTAATASSERTVIVAHSLGCLTVAHWAKAFPENAEHIQCALLVAPPDVESSLCIPEALRRFASRESIPFPSILVGSENDHHMTLETARKLAVQWGSCFINAGAVGHVNLDSGHGPWPQGEKLLMDIMKVSEK
ncbi:MAG: alpha/beta hydrolase [Deltaproteobacteria bacterium]